MSNTTPLEVIDLLTQFISRATARRFEKYCQLDFQIEENCPEIVDSKYASEMGVIMLWGAMGSFNLKVHFDLDLAVKYAAQSLGHPIDQVTPKIAREFIREMGNLQAGYLRSFFDQNRVVVGMSLPFLASGEDENVFRKLRDPRAKFTRWKLINPLGEINCTAEILLLDPHTIQVLKAAIDAELKNFESKKDSSDDGEIEFI